MTARALTPYEKTTLGKISRAVALYHDRPIADVMARSTDDVLVMRYTVYFFAYYQHKIPISSIQRFFKHKAHGTVHNGLTRITQWVESDPKVKESIETLKETLKSLPRPVIVKQPRIPFND